MASINGYKSWIAGATGSQGVLGPEASWRVYILPRGAHASQASSGTLITFDSASAASRFPANYWIQVGTDTANLRKVSVVGGNSLSVFGSAVTVAQGDRVFLIGSTQPTVSGGSATYVPHTTIWARDDDAGTPITNSMLTTDSNGGFEFFAHNNLYDALIQDSNRSAQMSLVDIAVGVTATLQLSVPHVYNVKDPEFGALGTNVSTNDDRAAIQAALDAAGTDEQASTGGTVFLPRGTYYIGGELEVPRHVRVYGEGARNSIIRANDSFPVATAMVRIGTADEAASSTPCASTRLEHLRIHGSDRASVGVHSSHAQEGSGVYSCVVDHWIECGISFGGENTVQNASLLNVELGGYTSTSSGQLVGIRWTRVGGPSLLQDITSVYNALGAAGTTVAGYGILLAAGHLTLNRIHCEGYDNSIGITTSPVGSGGVHTIMSFDSHSSIVTDSVVQYNDNGQGSIILIGGIKSAARVLINDMVAGTSTTFSAGLPIYIHHANGNNPDILWSPSAGAPENFINPNAFRVGCSTTFDRTVGFSGGYQATILTGSAAGTISMANRNTFILSTGSSVHTLSGGVSGQFAYFIGAAGAAVDFVRGSTLALTAALVGISQNMSISFRCMPNGVSWVQVHPVAANGAFA